MRHKDKFILTGVAVGLIMGALNEDSRNAGLDLLRGVAGRLDGRPGPTDVLPVDIRRVPQEDAPRTIAVPGDPAFELDRAVRAHPQWQTVAGYTDDSCVVVQMEALVKMYPGELRFDRATGGFVVIQYDAKGRKSLQETPAGRDLAKLVARGGHKCP